MPMLSVSSLFSAYASITAFIGLVKQFYEQVIPERVRDYISGKIEEWFTNKAPPSTLFTLVIEQYEDGDYEALNQVFIACEAYLASKLRSCSTRLKASRMHKKEHVSFKLAQGERFSEVFEGIQLQWNFVCKNGNGSSSNLSQASDAGEGSRSGSYRPQHHFFELCFDPEYKDKVFDSYLPYILKSYDNMIERKKELRLFTLDWVGIRNRNSAWKSVTFNHPFTFDALAMKPEAKQAVVDDLDRFLGRREFYRKVGRAWKRGYLLFGPPGTGKSSLIAAVANYIKFDIYDLQLSSVPDDFFLRRLLLSTSNRSILVIEDIDCSLGLTDSRQAQINREVRDRNGNQGSYMGSQISLSGLLNFIDGIWSSCGDERLFIFTTNHKEKLDPALLRPGRMDMHIHMSYLTMPAFRVLALNYLNISGEHHLFNEIEELLKGTSVSPAQVAEELIKSEDPDVALRNLINMLKHYKWVQSLDDLT